MSHNSDTLQRFRGKPILFLAEVAKSHWGLFALPMLWQTLNSLGSLIAPFVFERLTAWMQAGTITPILALSALCLVFLSYLIEQLGFALSVYHNTQRSAKTSRGARLLLLDYTLTQSYDYFTRNLSGQTAGRINQIGESINQVAWGIIMLMAGGLTRIVFIASLMLTVHWQLALIFVVWVFGFYHHSIKKMTSIRAFNEELSNFESTTSGQVVDTITNFPVLFACGGAAGEIARTEGFIKNEATATNKIATAELRMLTARTNWYALLALVLLAASYCLITVGQLTLPQLSFVMGLWGACTGIEWLNWVIGGVLWNHAKAQEQLKNLLEPHTVIEATNAIALPLAAPTICFEDISFNYGGAHSVYKNLNLTFAAHGKVGLVGRSGSGKSTLISLILRYYDPTAGRITFDGIPLTQASRSSLQALCTVVPQDPSLFHRSVLENVRFANPEASIEQVQDACRKAFAHDFIITLPKGYDTLVGEHGVKLSVGQRQRIAIARAILKDAPLVIFDEATSALDSESEAAIQTAIATQFTGKTLIVIAHRLSTLRAMDRILVLDKGQIAEDGSPAELLAKPEGLFARFWKLQSDGFIHDQTQPPFDEPTKA